MKTVGVTVLAIVGGFVAGLVLSEIIGIVGMLHSTPRSGSNSYPSISL